MFRRIFKELITYLFNPTYENNLTLSFFERVKLLIVILIIDIIFGLIATLFPVIFISFDIIEPFVGNIASADSTSNILNLFLVNIILFPIFEELTDRLYLQFTPLNLSISLGIWGYYLSAVIIKTSIFETNNYFLLRVVITLVLILTLYLILNNKIIKKYLSNFWNKNFKYIFYFSILLFGFSHLGNYIFSLTLILLSPLVLLPQLISGVTFGFTRMKLGIIWSIVLHILVNTIVNIPTMLLGI